MELYNDIPPGGITQLFPGTGREGSLNTVKEARKT